MNIPKSWWYMACLGLAAAALLPWIARRLRIDDQDRCMMDGAEIAPANAVWIRSRSHGLSAFCSLYCAEMWLRRSDIRPLEIRVTNEATGRAIDASRAVYVRSQVVAHPPTRERRHVFGSEEEARRHVDGHFGRVLRGEERPFAAWTDSLRQPPDNPSSTHEVNAIK